MTTVKTAYLTVTVGSTPDGVVPTYNSTLEHVETRYPGAIQVATLAALTALPNVNLMEGALAYVLTLKDLFLLVSSTGLSANGIAVVSSSNGSFYWLRQNIGHRFWRTRTTWYLGAGSTTSSDENDGQSPTTPITTWAELNRRLAGKYSASLVINLQSTPGNPGVLSANSVIDFQAVPERNVDLDSNTYTVQIKGPTPVVLLTGSVTTATNAVPSTNTAPTLQDTSVANWTTHVGKMITIISGPSIGATAWVLKDVGGNTARVSEWVDITGNYQATAPLNGDMYQLSFPTIGSTDSYVTLLLAPQDRFNENAYTTQQITVKDLFVRCSFSQLRHVRLLNCTLSMLDGLYNGHYQVDASYISVGGAIGGPFYADEGTGIGAKFCGIAASIAIRNTRRHIFTQCIWQTGGLTLGFNNTAQVLLIACGFFDHPSTALYIGDECLVEQLTSPYNFTGYTYGNGNGTGIYIGRGGRFIGNSIGVAPKITGTVELDVSSQTLFIRPLVAGASVPATATLNSWATLSSNFSNKFFDYYYGTKIMV